MSRCQGNRGVSFQKCQIVLLSSHFSDNPVSLPLPPPSPRLAPAFPLLARRPRRKSPAPFHYSPCPPRRHRVPVGLPRRGPLWFYCCWRGRGELVWCCGGRGDAPFTPPLCPCIGTVVPSSPGHLGDARGCPKSHSEGFAPSSWVCPGEPQSPVAIPRVPEGTSWHTQEPINHDLLTMW